MRFITFISLLGALLSTSCSGNSKQEDKKTEKTTENVNTESKMKTIHLTKSEFLAKVANYETTPSEWKYLGDKPAVIDFYADWCGPCKAVAPILEELAGEYGEDIYIYKIDVDAEQELASVFGIRSIPTLLFIPLEGQPQAKMGAQPKNELKKTIDEILLKK